MSTKNRSRYLVQGTVSISIAGLSMLGISHVAIAERRLSVFTGDIPGRNPGCSIVSVDRLNAARMGRELLALEKGMSPKEVDAIVSGSPSEAYWLIPNTEYGVMRWSAVVEGNNIDLSLGFKNGGLREINLIWKKGNVRCSFGIED
jgi:hypothetical protein